MTKKKIYYWLKLEKDFFDKIEIKRLRRMAGGDTYTVIYLKMLLLSLKEDGNLFYDGIGDDFIDELSLDIDEAVDDVKMVVIYLQDKNLMELLSKDEYHLSELPEMVGKETDSAVRMRRKRLNDNKVNQITSHSDTSVQESYTEIEKELELDLELEKDKTVVGKPDIDYSTIVNYLNEKTGRNYKSTTKVTQKVIKARINEGFTIEDFKQVIDKKTYEWLNDKKWQKFLRPETLFGNKFEGYLNQEFVKEEVLNDMDELRRQVQSESNGQRKNIEHIGGNQKQLPGL